MKKIGLTIGKFAPLHKGHQFLIETALREMDEFFAIIYDCPEVINIPLKTRAEWIKKIYPSVRVIEAYDSPKRIGHDEESIKVQVDYIMEKVRDTKITHFYSSEWYGECVAKALGAINILVDLKREKFPVSGTLSRSDYEKYKNMIHPIVYQDLLRYGKI